jgi:hypothetical protein
VRETSRLTGSGLLLVPDLLLAAGFYLAWRAPHLRWAATPAECRLVMLLEGASILACALVGVYLEIGLIAFPLIMLGCAAWFVKTGTAGLSLPVVMIHFRAGARMAWDRPATDRVTRISPQGAERF